MTNLNIAITFIFLSYISIMFTYFVTIFKNKKLNIFVINNKYIRTISIIIISFILLFLYQHMIFYIYILLYNIKRLNLSIVSFVSFTLNVIFFSLFIVGFYNLIYRINTPIVVLCIYLSSNYMAQGFIMIKIHPDYSFNHAIIFGDLINKTYTLKLQNSNYPIF